MSLHTTELALLGASGFVKLSTEIAAEIASDSFAAWPTQCHTLKLRNDKDNTAACRLVIASFPSVDHIYCSKLPEEEEVFTSGGMNRVSTMDKYIALRNAADNAFIDGNIAVMMDCS